MMKLTYTGDHNLNIVVDNPDERLRKDFAARIVEALHSEFQAFLEEVSVAMRNRKPGETVSLKSKPIEITMGPSEEKEMDDAV